MSTITLDQQIKAVKREIAMRQGVYPKWVAAKKMKQETADHELAAMKAVLATLESLDAAHMALRAQLQEERRLMRGEITHVLVFSGEGAETFLCRGWDDCLAKFFDGIWGEGFDAVEKDAERKQWLEDFGDEDNWSRDEGGRRFCFGRMEIGEISAVTIYCVYQRDTDTEIPKQTGSPLTVPEVLRRFDLPVPEVKA